MRATTTRRLKKFGATICAFSGGLVGWAAMSSVPAGASASRAPITLAYITSETGEASSLYAGSQAGFLARIALQNAEGGVNGHKLVPLVIDDQSSPSTIVTAVEEADSRAFAIVSGSALMFLAAKYPNQQGVPVTGEYTDGPEWGEKPYTNMFSSDHGSVDPKYPVNTLIGSFLKEHGGTVVGSYGYGISPISAASARGTAQSFVHAGGTVGVLDTTVPYGSVDFTAAALTAKQQGVNAVAPSLDNDSNFALAEALEQAGVKPKVTLFATGYESDVIGSAEWPYLQGDYFLAPFRPFSLPDAGTKQMQAAMKRFAHFTNSQFPTFAEYESWLGADLMIKGLQMAGADPTHAKVITALRSIKAYTGNGLLPFTINFTNDFGHDPPDCAWIMQAQKKTFVAVAPTATCGKDLPGTSTISG